MSVSDGFLACKTRKKKKSNSNKRKGVLFTVLSLLEMPEFGGTDSCSLMSALDSIVNIGGNILLDDYNVKPVSATSNGINVNLGVYNGTLMMLKEERSWLVVIHYINHRLELAIKNAVNDIAQVTECHKFYDNIYYLFKNLDKLKI